MGSYMRLCHQHGQAGSPPTLHAQQGDEALCSSFRPGWKRPWGQGSWGLGTLHIAPIPFVSSQEDLEKPAPAQGDEAAKEEEEVAEKVGTVLQGYTRHP